MGGPVELHHDADGPPDAPVVVLAGALGTTVAVWERQLPALTDHFRVVRVDLRGHGASPVSPPPYEMAELAADVLALLDRLGVEQASWCGLSLGGMVAIRAAAEQPHRVRRLVLCSTTAGFGDPAFWSQRIATVRDGGTESVADGVSARWFTADYAAAHPEDPAWTSAMIAATADDGYLGCCHAVQTWDHVQRLAEITAPTLVIGGAHDRSIPVQPHAMTLATQIPGARLEVLDAAHLANVEQAEQFNQLLVDHLS